MNWFTAEGYWLSRLVFQRALAAIYLVAFLSAVTQFRALIGERGLTPVPRFVGRVPFRRAPSLFQLHYSDRFFAVVGWLGVAWSAALLVGLADDLPLWAHLLAWAVPWALYLSIVHVGQVWYGFGWETLLCEAGFLAIFLGPSTVAPPLLVLVALWWVLFRLEFGAGLIKLRGDRCWRDLTCLYYHHETQPMPNPLSWWFHHLPRWAHRVEAAANHVTQLVVPFLLFAPQPVRTGAAAVVIVTQGWLVLSGNFAWLNVLTMVIATTAVGGDAWAWLLPVTAPAGLDDPPAWYAAVVLALAVVVAVLSYWPVRNLISREQVMNTSFNPLLLVNTYGAFGSVTRIRHEVVIEGTADAVIRPDTVWHEYEFKGKPGDPRRLPRQFAPYHLRLDWLMWFAAISPSYAQAWFPALLSKLRDDDPVTARLLRHNPFPHLPPAHVRARLYRYRFTDRAERRETGAWWHRTLVGDYWSVGESPADIRRPRA
ncbi:lipase maturation factor family protein [Jiangella ureilytica]|uniref:Lipase maturation factor family protein n=1 Tax=Jiangella ureilytica TaxID=2530374 RepID=A0A4R4RP40_9ACTN|nr:lipase maturation factor family protein [Jiangella ureilytica]TDC51490.1 lipase maturation factor family protein [Jiangella ureilytica]